MQRRVNTHHRANARTSGGAIFVVHNCGDFGQLFPCRANATDAGFSVADFFHQLREAHARSPMPQCKTEARTTEA